MNKEADILILGRTWEEIQSIQQGTHAAKIVSGSFVHSKATDADIMNLEKYGGDGLREKQFHGVIDRLTTSGLI